MTRNVYWCIVLMCAIRELKAEQPRCYLVAEPGKSGFPFRWDDSVKTPTGANSIHPFFDSGNDTCFMGYDPKYVQSICDCPHNAMFYYDAENWNLKTNVAFQWPVISTLKEKGKVECRYTVSQFFFWGVGGVKLNVTVDAWNNDPRRGVEVAMAQHAHEKSVHGFLTYHPNPKVQGEEKFVPFEHWPKERVSFQRSYMYPFTLIVVHRTEEEVSKSHLGFEPGIMYEFTGQQRNATGHKEYNVTWYNLGDEKYTEPVWMELHLTPSSKQHLMAMLDCNTFCQHRVVQPGELRRVQKYDWPQNRLVYTLAVNGGSEPLRFHFTTENRGCTIIVSVQPVGVIVSIMDEGKTVTSQGNFSELVGGSCLQIKPSRYCVYHFEMEVDSYLKVAVRSVTKTVTTDEIPIGPITAEGVEEIYLETPDKKVATSETRSDAKSLVINPFVYAVDRYGLPCDPTVPNPFGLMAQRVAGNSLPKSYNSVKDFGFKTADMFRHPLRHSVDKFPTSAVTPSSPGGSSSTSSTASPKKRQTKTVATTHRWDGFKRDQEKFKRRCYGEKLCGHASLLTPVLGFELFLLVGMHSLGLRN